MTLVQIDYARVEYRIEGTGPVVVVLNGGHCSRETRLSHEKLKDYGFTVLTPSRPGYDDTSDEAGRSAEESADTLAKLLDKLHIDQVDLIAISAAGPTGLAFAYQYPDRVKKLIMENAVAIEWDDKLKKGAKKLFGSAEKVTWRVTKGLLATFPNFMVRTMMKQLTKLPVYQVLQRMSREDIEFVKNMIRTSQSGTGFINDLDHKIVDLSKISTPVLGFYTRNDKVVTFEHADRLAKELPNFELFESPADSHLIWIGSFANEIWKKRLEFLRS
ncbi:alpha/beta fold hydrolase [Cohnella sp. REN36]|uniref:alpha/beta fold hydrolase n=1 Tax=Cohnella sp. REN36 TaxID=2887347 RepID=UPI001D141DD0|nr:alpha/beta hydrolase [Cohnella sp. REN36]MCC3377583.1 alpha/beta hydrolase [Cohnella sp. REN36]